MISLRGNVVVPLKQKREVLVDQKKRVLRVAEPAASTSAEEQERHPPPPKKGRKGKRQKSAHSDFGRVVQLKEARQKQVNDLVEKLSFTDAKELLKKLALAQPSLVLDVAEKMLVEGGESDLDPDTELPGWCVCHHCQEMGTDMERKCCGKSPAGCISIMPVSTDQNPIKAAQSS